MCFAAGGVGRDGSPVAIRRNSRADRVEDPTRSESARQPCAAGTSTTGDTAAMISIFALVLTLRYLWVMATLACPNNWNSLIS